MSTTEGHHTTAITVRAPLPLQTMAEIREAGDLLAQAGFLGTSNIGEATVILMAAHQRNEDLISFQQKFHFRQGRFSMGAHAMLAEFEAHGGTYDLIERTADRAALTLAMGKREYDSVLTWADACCEPFVYAGKESEQLAQLDLPMEQRKFATKYRTPRSRMQMLWARAVSDGVVCVDPGARGALYTPEETADFTDAPAAARPAPGDEPVIDVTARVVEDMPPAPPDTPTEQPKRAAEPAPRTPWEDDAPTPEPDYGACPIDAVDQHGRQIKGRKWADLPNAWLETALAKHAALCLTNGHVRAITLELERRGAEDGGDDE